jgi:hypothetical protein
MPDPCAKCTDSRHSFSGMGREKTVTVERRFPSGGPKIEPMDSTPGTTGIRSSRPPTADESQEKRSVGLLLLEGSRHCFVGFARFMRFRESSDTS